jgi:hypothetical protein
MFGYPLHGFCKQSSPWDEKKDDEILGFQLAEEPTD